MSPTVCDGIMFFRFPYFFIIIIWAKTNKMYVNNPYCFSLYVPIPQLSWSDIIDVHPKPPFFLPYSQHRLSTNFSACEESCVTHLNVFRIFLVSSSPNKSLPIIPRVLQKKPPSSVSMRKEPCCFNQYYTKVVQRLPIILMFVQVFPHACSVDLLL